MVTFFIPLTISKSVIEIVNLKKVTILSIFKILTKPTHIIELQKKSSCQKSILNFKAQL
jgi:hypothetical protein